MKKIVVALLMTIALLTGCQASRITEHNTKIVQVYNPFEYAFDVYAISGKKPETKEQSNDNRHQYSFATTSRLFTSGDSYNNGFEILEYTEGKLKTKYRLPNEKTDAIFPLAENDAYNLFFIADYSQSGLPMSKIVRFDDKNLYPYVYAVGMIDKGVIIDSDLYYTTYDAKMDCYALFRIALDNYENKPILIEDGLISGDLFAFNNQLAKTTDSKILYKNSQFDKASINYYDNDTGKLIQINPNSKNNNQLQLKVIDVEQNKVETIVENVIGLDFNSTIFKVYCMNEIRIVSLSK